MGREPFHPPDRQPGHTLPVTVSFGLPPCRATGRKPLSLTRSMQAVTAVALGAALLAGCSDQKPDPPTASSSASPVVTVAPSPSADPAAVAASTEVLNRYRRFRAVYVAAGRTADHQNKDLLSYLETPMKQEIVAFLFQMSQKNIVYSGAPQSNPKITRVDLSAKPQTVTIEDCYDATNYILVYKSNLKPVPTKGDPRRIVLQTTATNYGADRGWLLTKSQILQGRTC